MPKREMIRDPVHNYIIINEQEKKLIDTSPVQRLRYVKQTPSASYVYPGANHTRFEHSLGVCHLVRQIAKSLEDNGYIDLSNKEKKNDIQKARIAALLHDIGHGPFSHTFEGFIKMLGVDLSQINHEKITRLIIEKCLADKIKRIFDYDDEDVIDISKMAVGEFTTKLYLSPFIGSQIDADKMDYLQRDALHTGTIEYGSIDFERLVLNFELFEDNGIKKIGIRERAAFAIEELFLSRYQMYRAVYYHRTARSFDLMLCDAMTNAIEKIQGLTWFKYFREGLSIEKIKESDELEKFLSDYLPMNDYSLMSELNTLAKNDEKIAEIMYKIRNREHYRHCYDTIFFLDAPFFASVLDDPAKKAKEEEKIKSAAEVSNMVRIDVPHPILMLDHSFITIVNGDGNRMLLRDYIASELGKEKLSIMHSLSNLGKRFVIVNVFTDTKDKEIRKKIKEASMKHLRDAEPPFHI